jgi:hypothetical protein
MGKERGVPVRVIPGRPLSSESKANLTVDIQYIPVPYKRPPNTMLSTCDPVRKSLKIKEKMQKSPLQQTLTTCEMD